MSDVETQGESQDTGGDDEAARYAEMEANLEGGSTEAEGEESEAEEKPQRSRLSAEELERRHEQKALALKHERRRRQELESRLAVLEQRAAPVRQEQAMQDFDIPDAVDDPIGALAALRQLATNMTAQQRQEAEQQAQRQAQQSQTQQIASRMSEYENDFRELTPDYDTAVEHFRKDREADLKEQGYEGQELARALTTEFIGLVTRSLHAGKDPAEVVYALAKKRGYTGIDKATTKLQTLKSGQAAASTLNQGGGKQGEPQRLTMTDVSKLKGQALLDGFSKLRAQERGR